MFLVDSHCHIDQLDLSPYHGDLTKAIEAATRADVKHILCVCITLADFPAMMTTIKPYLHISASVGLHPNELVDTEPSTDELIELASHDNIVAIGETGLDYFRTTGDVSWQQERFRRHIRAAIAVNKPLIIHCRQAKQDVLTLLREERAEQVGGVMHCFSEDWVTAEAAMAMNFYISLSGVVTFKNAKETQEVAKALPLDRMLIETDSPYLAPVPYRGKSNEPAYVRQVAEYIAALRQEALSDVAEQTTQNFFTLFKQAKRSLYAKAL